MCLSHLHFVCLSLLYMSIRHKRTNESCLNEAEMLNNNHKKYHLDLLYIKSASVSIWSSINKNELNNSMANHRIHNPLQLIFRIVSVI